MEKNAMETAIEATVKLLTDKPDRVSVVSATTTDTVFYDVQVDKSDLGTVIGAKGKHANAIRTIFMAASAAQGGKRITITFNPRK